MFRPLLSSVAVIFLTASTLPAQDWARKLFATTEHDFGSVARGAKADYAFIMTNNLQDDVHIASVRSSCGCTSPYVENDKRTLKTYENGRDHRPPQQRHARRSTGRHADGDLRSALLCRSAIADPRPGAYRHSHGAGQLAVRHRRAGQGERSPGAAVSRRLPQLADPERSPFRSESARRSGPLGAAGRPGLVRFEGPPCPHGIRRAISAITPS